MSVVARVFEPQERKQLHGVVGGYTVAQESFAKSPTLAKPAYNGLGAVQQVARERRASSQVKAGRG